MLSEQIRRRLEQLNRGPLPKMGAAPASDPAESLLETDEQKTLGADAAGSVESLTRSQASSATAPSSDAKRPGLFADLAGGLAGLLSALAKPRVATTASARLASAAPLIVPALELLGQGCEIENASGKHWRCQAPLRRLWPDVGEAIDREEKLLISQAAALAAAKVTPTADREQNASLLNPRPLTPGTRPLRRFAGRRASRAHDELAAVAAAYPARVLFLDLETCGFAGSMIFLVGLIRFEQGELVLDQLLAKDYRQERAMLESLWGLIDAADVLVTFNGKTFDWPMVRDRSARHLFADKQSTMLHCDLLHHARRKYRDVLPNCKLQTLEQFVCRRHRREDISGAEIPAAYHAYVRDGHPDQMQSILAHNALDLLTLLQVTLRMTRAGAGDM